jgi:hypothetical protein
MSVPSPGHPRERQRCYTSHLVSPNGGGAPWTTLQVFWRDWPRVGAWAGALWRQLDADLAVPSSSMNDADIDEVGGEG